MGKLILNGFDNNIAYAESMGLSKVFEAYAENSAEADDIMEIGFNPNSGYVYIALENGVSIASMLGQSVEYIVSDFETGEEFFFDDYDEAIDQLEQF